MAKGVYKPETKVRKAMQSLGVYEEEFDPIISIYCELKKQYDELTERFEKDGYKFSEETTSGSKKAPIVTTLEGLRRDILTYSAQLGLTPAGLRKLRGEATENSGGNALIDALKAMRDE